MRIFGNGALALLVAGALAAPTQARAQVQIEEENTGIGTAAAEFLLLGAGARGMALGPSYAALVRDVESTYYNPAGLPLMEGPQAELSMMSYFAETDYVWAGFGLPLANGEFGLGLSLGSFGFSDAPVFREGDPEGEEGLLYDVRQTAIGLSFAHAFIDRFTGGVTLKYISDQLGQTEASGFAVDVGTNFHTEWNGRPIALAFVIQNLGSTLQHSGAGLQFNELPEGTDELPVTAVDPFAARFLASDFTLPIAFRVGVSYDVLSNDANRLSLLGQFSEVSNINQPGFGFAGEYEWTPVDLPVAVALRGGYEFQSDNDVSEGEQASFGATVAEAENEGMDGLALGGGLEYNLGDYGLGFDYAYRHFGVLGSRNVFSVSFGW
ncbi:MAG TPA: PorV/PorQ family protein [Longimicrobiales bacterium]|nr:PorV/PorQ family protein [Longimicrobiales bacterium]